MAPEIGIRMKVLRNTGSLVDALNDDLSADDPEQEEFQHLIVIPKSPLRGKCATLLRIVFFGLISVTLISVSYLLVKDYLSHSNRQVISSESLLTSFTASKEEASEDICLIQEDWKIDCFPGPGATSGGCLERGCCWKPLDTHLVPWCYFSAGSSYYNWDNFTQTKLGLSASAVRIRKSPYPKDVDKLNINVIFETENIVRIKITDAKKSRFEVPLDYKSSKEKAKSRNYTVESSQNGIKIFRKGEVTPIFDTTIAPLIYADQFLQISTSLLTEFVYGIGESVDKLKRNITWSQYILYNKDGIPGPNVNNYGSHPFYMVMDKGGRSHGVFLANSNAMEIIIQPGPALTFRTIGGIIDLRIFLGPTPADVTEQYTSVIGRPMIPPYWSLGFHLCRFNYGTVNHTAEILENNLGAGIPIDVQWNDLDYMKNQNDFTYDTIKFAGLPNFVDKLHKRGMRYIPLIDPGISGGEGKGNYDPYDSGIKMDIFVKADDGTPFVGKVWNPTSTVWPDFSHPNVTKYWLNQIEGFRKKVPFDGAWIDMNEPSNFWDGSKTGCVSTSSLDNPPYVPHVEGSKLYYKTICPSARQAGGRHYDLHNLYGTQETIVTYKVLGDLTNERPFIISRSTFPGQGRYGGHWTGDVVSSWEDMRQSIPQVLSFGLFGIPMVGADICGFNGNTTVELCKRWSQLGAFYPFSRNHNTDNGIPQDPYSLGPEVVAAAKETLKIRYSLLPYLYTLFFRAHLTGQPVARALFYEFPTDAKTFFVDDVFMLGNAVLVVPILEKSFAAEYKQTYLPLGYWYNHYSDHVVDSLGESTFVPVEPNSIPVLYRGGSIIVKQEPLLNTVACRKSNFFIQAFLSKSGSAEGEFFWDDGVSNLPDKLVQYISFKLSVDQNNLRVVKVFDGFDSSTMTLGQIEIRGIRGVVKEAVLNNVPYNFTLQNQILRINGMNLTGSAWTDGITLTWNY